MTQAASPGFHARTQQQARRQTGGHREKEREREREREREKKKKREEQEEQEQEEQEQEEEKKKKQKKQKKKKKKKKKKQKKQKTQHPHTKVPSSGCSRVRSLHVKTYACDSNKIKVERGERSRERSRERGREREGGCAGSGMARRPPYLAVVCGADDGLFSGELLRERPDAHRHTPARAGKEYTGTCSGQARRAG